MKGAHAFFLLAAFSAANALAEGATQPEERLPSRIQGDLGILVDEEQSPIKGDRTQAALLPFAFFDYGRMYARIDTFGIKTVPVAYGYLELAGRVKFDGYKAAGNAALRGIGDRQDSAPIGLGTFQETPIGGFFVYALHDLNRSRGNLLDFTYAAELKVGDITAYPEAGFEYYSNQYTQYYYGVSASEAGASGYAAYRPGSVANPFLCLFLQAPLTKGWNANFYLRRKWLGAAIANSPLVDTKRPDAGFVAITAHFE